jgi:hypothetical protein
MADSGKSAGIVLAVVGAALGGYYLHEYLRLREASRRDHQMAQRTAPPVPAGPPLSFVDLHAPVPSGKLTRSGSAEQVVQDVYVGDDGAPVSQNSKYDGGGWL